MTTLSTSKSRLIIAIILSDIFALIILGMAYAQAAPSDQYFTSSETHFLADERGAGITPAGNGQALVDFGWAIETDVANGTNPITEANVIYRLQSAPRGLHDISWQQALATVNYAVTDLTGTPSPGGRFSAPSTHSSAPDSATTPDGIHHETIV